MYRFKPIFQYSIFVLIGFLLVLFVALVPGFGNLRNLLGMLAQAAVTSVAAYGLAIIMIGGEIDLSFAGSFPLLAYIFARQLSTGSEFFIAIATILVLGFVIGLINAATVVYMRVPSFLATAVMMFLLTGLYFAISGGHTIYIKGYYGFLFGFWGPIPKITLLLLILTVVLHMLTEHTQWGVVLKAIGENPEYAFRIGVNVSSVKLIAFALGGVLFSVAALIAAIRLSSATGTLGSQVLLPVMASAFMSTVVGSGKPNIWGALVASYLLQVIACGFGTLGLPFWATPMAQGLLLLFLVALANVGEKRGIGQVSLG